jgi:hypothetical protein
MENEKQRLENAAPETKAVSLGHGETAVPQEVSEVRIDVERGTITLKLAAKQ